MTEPVVTDDREQECSPSDQISHDEKLYTSLKLNANGCKLDKGFSSYVGNVTLIDVIYAIIFDVDIIVPWNHKSKTVELGLLHHVMEFVVQNVAEFLLMEFESMHSLEQSTTINANLALPNTIIHICAK